MFRNRCMYCNKEFDKLSREHIIPNGLYGRLISSDICCNECNNELGKLIDAPFVSIFNPILNKLNLNYSNVETTGVVDIEGKTYDNVKIKNGKPIYCYKYSKQYNKAVKNTEMFTIIAEYFNLNNDDFRNGLIKIAYEFAKYNKIPIIGSMKIDSIKSRFSKVSVIPYIPLNPIEYSFNIIPINQLYHELIIMASGGKLWCYIELFNTFQYYILLGCCPYKFNSYNIYRESIQDDTLSSRLYDYIKFVGSISESIIIDNVKLLNMIMPIRNNLFYKRYSYTTNGRLVSVPSYLLKFYQKQINKEHVVASYTKLKFNLLMNYLNF